MALRLLGQAPIDIHAGGVDLIFPHHENEIAQAEGATKETFRVSGCTSSISSSRTRRCRSRWATSTPSPISSPRGSVRRPSAICLSSHYRKQLNFTWSGMEQAEESLRRVVDFLVRSTASVGKVCHGK